MRLGAYDCEIEPGTKVAEVYDEGLVRERHRHRFELNNDLKDDLATCGLVFSVINPEKTVVEIIVLPAHGGFVGVQFHP